MSEAFVIGAGLAGLSAAVELARAGVKVRLADSAPRAGGRCRSYHDPALGMVIDNGNHFTFSGNQAVARFLETIGASAGLQGPDHASFAFHDLADGSRWNMQVNDGLMPLWMLCLGRSGQSEHWPSHQARRPILAPRG
jgi:hydroxysqualene dehydroxylase